MVLHRKISRRRFVAGAGVTAAAALDPARPVRLRRVSPAGAAGTGRLIPPGKHGHHHVHPARRAEPGRHRGERRARRRADDGLPRRARLPGRPDRPRPAGAAARRLAGAAASSSRAPASSRSSSPATARTPPTPAARRPTRPRAAWSPPESRAAYLAYARTLRGFLDEFGLEAIGNHGFIPSTWPGPNSPGGAMSTADYDRFQLELEFASILGMPYMGTGNDPTSANNRNIEPWTIAGEKWEALNGLSLPVGHPPLPAQPLAGLQLPPGRSDGDRHRGPAHRRADPADRGARRVRQAADAALPRHHRPASCASSRWTSSGRTSRSTSTAGATTGRATGSRTSSTRLATVAQQTKRYALFHAKDGDRTARAARRRQRLRHDPVRRPAQRHRLPAVLPQHRARRATTTPTTSRTTHPAAPPTRASPCGSAASAGRTWETCAADPDRGRRPHRGRRPLRVVRISDWLIHTRDRNAKLVAGSLV